jgi:phosphatidylserine/phosphatidylglycerophosphate/cardiolipin synthase-like enzyme
MSCARWLVALLVVVTMGCISLPSLEGRNESSALTDTDDTRLGRAIAGRSAAHPGKTGIHALHAATDAFAARVLLARAAEKSLDVQYYIWHGDQTGSLLFEAVWRAAERGVRVRILLDDINTSGLDETLATLDAHPNIEVRLYNPLVHRSLRMLNFLTDFARVNRRMHNKSFTADNQATIVGGRNIGNEYFGAGSEAVFVDLDVIAVGPVVRDVSQAFDLYWNSASAYPLTGLVVESGHDAVRALEARFAAARADPEAVTYLDALRDTAIVQNLLAGELTLEWTDARVLRDDPAKTLDTAERKDLLLLSELLRVAGQPKQSLDLVSPYFVPGDGGTSALRALAGRGVAVRILTNSLAATDVAAVHAGYAKRRRDLLDAGVQLYELKPTAMKEERDEERRGFGGSSSESLHAKTFALDRERIFVGSFNFDQRSALLNTEMGLMIESRPLASLLAAAFETKVPAAAYEVRPAAESGLEWIERTPAGEIRYATEPHTGFFKRMWLQFLSILPIEWLL